MSSVQQFLGDKYYVYVDNAAISVFLDTPIGRLSRDDLLAIIWILHAESAAKGDAIKAIAKHL